MSLQLVGIIGLLLAAISLLRPPAMILRLVVIASVFGTAAAVLLPALGGASILLANLFVPFLVVRMVLWAGPMSLVSPLAARGPGLWLLLFTIYALASAYFLPRVFIGTTNTVTVVESTAGLRLIRFVPLGPVTGNITQSVYLLGGVAAFAAAVAFLQRTRDYALMLNLLIVTALLHLAATVIDLVTYYSDTAQLLDPIRNANYTYHTAEEKAGIKRLCAFFSEASMFASYTLVLFAVFFNLWLDRIRTVLTGPIALFLLAGLVFSTSGAGYVALPVLLALVLAGRSVGLIDTLPMRRAGAIAILAGAGVVVAVVVLIAAQALLDSINLFFADTVFGKLESASGRERSLWNATAIQNFLDTNYLGAGLGSSRASGLGALLLANVGVPGTLLFILFIAGLLFSPVDPALGREARALVGALRWAIVAQLLVALLTKTDLDFGLLFYVVAGAVASALMHRRAANSARAWRPAAAAQ